MTNLQTGGGIIQLRSNTDFAGLYTRLRFEHGRTVHSDAEKSKVALEDVDKDIEDCDAEIYRLQRRTVFFQKQRRRLEEYKACLSSIGSCIRKFPNETLLRIFDLACDMNEITSKNVKTMPALAISGVWFRWRDLARSSSELWSRLCIEMQKSPPNLCNFPVLDFFLSSSHKFPLTLDITGEITSNLQTHHLDLCDAITAHSNRWRSIVVSGVYQVQRNVYDVLACHGPRQYPILKELTFPTLDITDGLNQYQHAPKLQRLSIGKINLAGLAISKFPWTQLTHFSYASCGEEMENILQMCGKLAFLQMKDAFWAFRHFSPTTAPTLETLSLESYDDTRWESTADVAFSSLTCPSLTSLIIEAKKEATRPWLNVFLNAFISRSSFHLTTLSIKFIPITDTDLIDLFYRIPSLLHITIDESKLPHSATSPSHILSPITPRLLRSLHGFPWGSFVVGFSPLVQKLQSLEVTYAGSDFDDEGFVDMVSSRWLDDDGYGLVNSTSSGIQGTACLRSVVLHFRNRELDVTKFKPMEYLEKAGMRVVLSGSKFQ